MRALDYHRRGDAPSVVPVRAAPKRFPTRTTVLAQARVREFCAVVNDRTRDGIVFDHRNAARVLANALAIIYRSGGDMLMVEKLAPGLDPDQALAALNDVDRVVLAAGASYRAMRAGKAGELLGLTLDEVVALKIRTMRPMDETAEQRAARQVEAKRKADRERARSTRGRKPRDAFLASSLTKSRPWEAEGISRRTWERRRAAGALGAGVSLTFSEGDLLKGDTPATSEQRAEHCDAAS